MESELGRFKQELGDERKKVDELSPYKLHYEQQQQQKQGEPKKQPTVDELNTQFFDNPTQTLNQRDMNMAYNQAFAMAPIALATAKIQNPEAFIGISDQEVEQAMQGGVKSGTTNPMLLSDPNAYVGAAWILRGAKTGYKIPEEKPSNMSPTETERPGGSPPSTEEEVPELTGADDLTALLISKRSKDTTKEDFIKKMQTTREREGR